MKRVAGVFGILVAVVLLTSLSNPQFIGLGNLTNVARWTGMYGILTIGAAFVIITGGIDLSIGSVVGLSGSMLPLLLVEKKWPVALAVGTVLLMTVCIGWIHGLLITRVRIQPFIVTLCGLFIYRGLARYITHDETQGFGMGFDSLKFLAKGSPLGLPMPFWILILIALAAWWALNLSVFGRHVFAVGGNEEAARYSGVNTARTITAAYVASALLAGVGGIIFALDLNSVQPSGHGNFYELYAIAGAVLGGCSLRGGSGTVLGVVIGTALVRVLYNAINILGIPTQLEFAVIGLVILLGVVGDELVKRVGGRRAARPGSQGT